MNNKSISVCLLLAAALVMTAMSSGADIEPAGEKITLKPKFVPGDYLQTITMETDQVVVLSGQERSSSAKQIFEIAMHIGRPDSAGVKEMTLRYKRVRQRLSQGGVSMSYDSASTEKQDPNLAKSLGALTKAVISAKIGPDEKIKEVGGMDSMWDELAKADPSFAQVARMMKNAIGDRMMKEMIEGFWANFPPEAVAVGDDWQIDTDMTVPAIGKVKTRTKGTLKSIEKTPAGKIAVIDLAVNTVSQEDQPAVTPVPGMKMEKMVIEMAGKQRFNVDNPMLNSTTMNSAITVSMSMPPQGDTGQDVTMQSRFKTRTVIETRRAAPPQTQPAAQPAVSAS